MSKRLQLRKFDRSELVFNKEETINILKFIFKKQHENIDSLNITDSVREFAQGLLLEAVDTSYEFGFIDSLFRAVTNPRSGIKKVLAKFGKKSMKHWFKYANSQDLMSIKIYERVRQQLEWSFGRVLILHVNGIAKLEEHYFGVLAINESDRQVVWG